MQPASTKAILERGRDELLVRGWTRGRYEDAATGEVCILRALYHASRELVWPHEPVYRGVQRAATVMRSLTADQSLPEWNDQPGRQPEELLALFDAAIAKSAT